MRQIFVDTRDKVPGGKNSDFSILLPQTLHGLTIKPATEPGILMEVTIDKNGDLDRQSFLGEVVAGKQQITKILPKLNP